MMDKRKATRERVAKWRKALAERGGKEVTMALEALALARLDRLKKRLGVPAGEVVGFGLAILERNLQVYDLDLKNKGQGKDE